MPRFRPSIRTGRDSSGGIAHIDGKPRWRVLGQGVGFVGLLMGSCISWAHVYFRASFDCIDIGFPFNGQPPKVGVKILPSDEVLNWRFPSRLHGRIDSLREGIMGLAEERLFGTVLALVSPANAGGNRAEPT